MTILKLLFLALLFKTSFSSNDTKTEVLGNYLKLKGFKFCYFITNYSKQYIIEITQALHRSSIRSAIVKNIKHLETNIHDKEHNTAYIFTVDDSDADLTPAKNCFTNLTQGYILLLIADAQHLQKSLEILKACDFGINSKLVIVKKSESSYEFFNYYRKPGSGFKTSLNGVSFYKERYNLTGFVVRAVSTKSIDYKYNAKTEREVAVSQFHYGLFALLQEIHNFAHDITFKETSKNGDFGNGHVSKYLQNNKSDVYITGELQISSKVDELDFLMPFYNFRTCFFHRLPKKSTVSFIKPFSRNTWFAIILSTLIFTAFLKIALVMSEADETTWAISFLTVFSTLCQDGDDPSPSERDTGCKLVFLSILVLSLLLFNYYTSIMVSLLLSAEVETDHTIEHLARSNLEIGIENEFYVKSWLENVNFTDVQHLYKAKLSKLDGKSLNTFSASEGLVRLGVGGFAFYTDTTTAYGTIGGFAQDQICSIAQTEMIPPIFVGLVMGKKSQYFELFQISLLKLRQVGLVHRIQMKWGVAKPECYGNTEVVPVGMEQGVEALACLLSGLLLGPVVLLCEVFLKKRRG
ncbi:hypothetical protein TcasGA2_TC032489 [Tribolium castaneum]|uniref:Ionotropic glutamate receptor C-terminal domain-containing protein n=1 Tax=Tribolium castaneum TaxID=7070 RepID=A0A139WL89_TRICA|nr:hypothetical protein TcasGA2_TC032489 [Tribolium castaneum]